MMRTSTRVTSLVPSGSTVPSCSTRSSFFFFSSGRRHTTCLSDWSSDVGSSDLQGRVLTMPSAPDLAGSALDGRYELHELVGEGTFGRVYRGLDRRLRRAVAIKVIKPWWSRSEERRVGKECRCGWSLHHAK